MCCTSSQWQNLRSLKTLKTRPIYRRHTRSVPTNLKYDRIFAMNEGYARAIITYEGQIQLRINSQNFKKPEFIVEVDNNGEFQIDLLKAINDYSVQIEIVTKKYGRKSQKINFTHDNIDREPTFLVSDYGTRNYQPPLLNGTIHELFYSKSMNPFELYEIKKST
uniref:Glyco_hydro_38C domain-containing protein n=1 Tax=Meloidogyne hapla TaxID=6305 RepID=A0A1I8BEY9_MELHA